MASRPSRPSPLRVVHRTRITSIYPVCTVGRLRHLPVYPNTPLTKPCHVVQPWKGLDHLDPAPPRLCRLVVKLSPYMIRRDAQGLDWRYGRQDLRKRQSKTSGSRRCQRILRNHSPESGIFTCQSALPLPQDCYRLPTWPLWEFSCCPTTHSCFVVTA